MQQKKYSETFEFEYIDSVQLKNGSFIGGVSLPEHDDELIIFVTPSENESNEKKFSIHMSGSKQALKEFGKHLINVSNFNSLDENYKTYLDELKGNAELNIYSPESCFQKMNC